MKLIRNRLFLATICIILSALCVFTFLRMNQSDDITVYKLTQDITKGTQITDEMLTVLTVGSKGMTDVILDRKEIVGKYSAGDLVDGQIIMKSSISEVQNEILQGLDKLDGEHFAYAISVSSLASSVANKIQAGDIVSIFVYDNNNSIFDTEYSYLPESLKYVEVLNANVSTGLEKEENGTESIAAVTLIVDNDQALLLNKLEYSAQIHLALVHRGEDEKKQEYLKKN